jgi:hypothetical protein
MKQFKLFPFRAFFFINVLSLFLRYNQQDVTFLNLFISITLYMFRVEPPPIIRSSDCTYSFWYLSSLAATCRYNLQEFPCIIHRNCRMRKIAKLWIKKSKLTYFDALWMRSEGNAPKNGQPTFGFSFTTMIQHTGRFLSRISLATNNVTTLEHHPYSSELDPTDFYPLPRLKSSLKGRRCCDAIGIIGMRRKCWKGFHKIASMDVSNIFIFAGRIVQLQKVTNLNEIWLKWLYCFVFLRNRVIPGTFWNYHV